MSSLLGLHTIYDFYHATHTTRSTAFDFVRTPFLSFGLPVYSFLLLLPPCRLRFTLLFLMYFYHLRSAFSATYILLFFCYLLRLRFIPMPTIEGRQEKKTHFAVSHTYLVPQTYWVPFRFIYHHTVPATTCYATAIPAVSTHYHLVCLRRSCSAFFVFFSPQHYYLHTTMLLFHPHHVWDCTPATVQRIPHHLLPAHHLPTHTPTYRHCSFLMIFIFISLL